MKRQIRFTYHYKHLKKKSETLLGHFLVILTSIKLRPLRCHSCHVCKQDGKR